MVKVGDEKNFGKVNWRVCRRLNPHEIEVVTTLTNPIMDYNYAEKVTLKMWYSDEWMTAISEKVASDFGRRLMHLN